MTVKLQQDLIATVTNRCHKLLERIPHLAWLMTDRGQIVAVNQQWYEFLGQCNGAQMPEIFTKFLHNEDLDKFLISWAEANKLQQPLEIELRLKSISGTWEWFRVEAEPDSDQDSQITWIATAVRLGSQAAVSPSQQSAQFLAALLDYASDGIVACDADGHLVLFNRTAQAFHGLPPRPIDPEEWANYYDLYDADGLKILTKSEIPLFQALEGKSVVSQEMMIKPKQSKARSLLASGAAIYSTTGEKLGAVVLMRDITHYKQAETDRLQISGLVDEITEQKRVEIALQASEELFRHTFEYTSMGFCHVALDGTMSRLNDKFCEIVGYSQEELSGTTFQAITEPADLAKDLALVEQLLNGDINEYTLEKRYVHKEGHHIWVCLTVSLVREIKVAGELGIPQYFISAIQDITDRKQLELMNLKQTIDLQRLNRSLVLTQESLKERNQELDSFVYVVSHDLKAPLRAIANLSIWIEEDLEEKIAQASQQQFLLLRQRIYRMDALIDGLLRYSQVGRQALESEVVDVAKLLPEIIDSLAPPENFKIEFLSPLPTILTKSILLSQVFANLLSNAIKHHDRTDGLIKISAVDLGDFYQFSIADDGPGISVGADQERIFEMFQTLKLSDTKENTGIGLAVVKKIVEGEGGRIWLDNQHKSGACFCFTWVHNNNLES